MRLFAAQATAREAAAVARAERRAYEVPRAERLAAPGVDDALVSAAMEGVAP